MKTFLESLEDRIAPAVLIAANGLSASYTDVDGDLVTVKISAGALEASNFTTAATGLGDQLQSINLTAATIADGANLTVSVKKSDTGDGLANIGQINGIVDLGTVVVKGDLGRFTLGDASTSNDPSVKSLTVDSLGLYGTSTGAGSTASVPFGGITSLVVKKDIFQASVITSQGGIGVLSIGGSLVGGDASGSGQIKSDGVLGALKIGGDIRGGTGANSGQVTATSMGSVSVGGSIVGNEGNSSGAVITTFDKIGAVKVGGNIAGGGGTNSGMIDSQTDILSISVGGSVSGTDGSGGGRILAEDSIGPVKIVGDLKGGSASNTGQVISSGGDGIASIFIGGSMVGAAGSNTGTIQSSTDLGPITIKGSVIGGTGAINTATINASGNIASVTIGGSLVGVGNSSANITASDGIGPVKITGDLRGGDGPSSGVIFTSSSDLASLTIGGSLVGGLGDFSGIIIVGSIAKGIKIGHDIIGASATGADSIDRSGYIQAAGVISSISIGGSIFAGVDDSTGALTKNASIRALTLGTLSVKGSILGSLSADGNTPVIIAANDNDASATTNVVIKSLTVGKSVQFANILAGFDNSLAAVNGSAQIGAVKVGGNWLASNLVAGVQNTASTNTSFGNAGDALIPGGDPLIIPRIASIVIGGQVAGLTGGTEHFGFAAQQIGVFKTAGFVAPVSTLQNAFIQLSLTTADAAIHAVA